MLNARELEQIVAAMNAMPIVVFNSVTHVPAASVIGVLKAFVAKDDLDMLKGSDNEPRGNGTCR